MHKTISIFCILLLVACIFPLIGCGDNANVSSITVTPSTPSVGIGLTRQFYAQAYGASGTPLSATFSWGVSGSAGSINSTSGLFTASGSPGSVSVIATSGGITGSTTASIITTGSISGTILDSSGKKTSGIPIFLCSIPTLASFSDTSGVYTISGIPPATYTVRTQENALYISCTTEATVATGETATGNITLGDRISLVSDTITQNPVAGYGTVKNNGSTEATGVSGIYIFYDSNGDSVGLGQSTIGTMASGESKAFILIIPQLITSYSSITKTFAATSY
ncbi:MAG: carboxypeptidase regulatory-like domain-containing protein [Candidatus Saganbacteria bacterium]|nr:carboxypeptidase regulatory-like domain-containing protein [Candidatus Saganbacteria bacterium]